MNARPLLILGAGTFAIEVLEAAELAGLSVVGFVVSAPSFRTSLQLEGRPVLTPHEVHWTVDEVQLVGGIVSTKRRALILEMVARGFHFGRIRHPTAIVSPRATVAEGTMIGAGVIIGANTQIGSHTILNRGANIAHDVQLGAFATVGPGAVIAGGVLVGTGAWLGVGAVVRDHIEIGAGALIAAGALAVKSVPPHTLVAGSPARPIRKDVDGF